MKVIFSYVHNLRAEDIARNSIDSMQWLQSKHLSYTPDASTEGWKRQFLLPQPLVYSRVRLVDNWNMQSSEFCRKIEYFYRKFENLGAVAPVESTSNNIF